MRLRFWDPGIDGALYDPMYGVALQPRRINLTHLHTLGEEMRRLVGAPRYRVHHVPTQQDITLDDLEKLLPELRYFELSATDPALESGTPATPSSTAHGYVLTVIPDRPTYLRERSGSEQMAQALAATANTYGHPVRDWTWIFPALFFTAVAIALAPVVWLWVQGQLSLWLIPLVAGLTVMAAVVATPHLRVAIARRRQSRSSIELDFRYGHRVRHDRAAQRLALWSGVVGAALGAVATVLAGLMGGD